MIESLGDSNDAVRKSAAEALEKLGALTIELKIKRYVADLDDSNKYVRRPAARALGQIGDSRAIPALRQALEDEEYDSVREAIERALKKLSNSSSSTLSK